MALLALEQLRERGNRVLLACPADTALERAARGRRIRVHPCPFIALRRSFRPQEVVAYVHSILVVGARLRRFCRDEKVDVVHAFSVISALYALAARLPARIRFVLHVQDAQPPRPLRRVVLLLLARRASCLICVSRAVQDMLRGIGIGPDKLVLLHNAVEPAFLGSAPEPTPEISGPGPHVGMFAHVIPWKGHQVFLRAAALLAERFPTARFYIVGGRLAGVPATYLDSLESAAAVPPLAGRVRLTGARADVASWMAAMDVIVHTSIAPEAFGLVICEGMALGKPVVASDCGAPREFVTHGETGYLVPPGDPGALALVLEYVLEKRDPQVGNRAAATTRARFAPEIFGSNLARVYRDVLPRVGAAA